MQRIRFETGQIVEFIQEDETYLTIRDNNEEIVLRKLYLGDYKFLNVNTEKRESKLFCDCQCPYHDAEMRCKSCGKIYNGWIGTK